LTSEFHLNPEAAMRHTSAVSDSTMDRRSILGIVDADLLVEALQPARLEEAA